MFKVLAECLTGNEIGDLMTICEIYYLSPPRASKKLILEGAFAEIKDKCEKQRALDKFIRQAMIPEFYIDYPERFERMRGKLNIALSFAGYSFDESGELIPVERTRTLEEAARLAQELKEEWEKTPHPPGCAALL